MVHNDMAYTDWYNFQPYILQLEQEGKVTRTFRRLDPERQQAVINAILEEAAEKGPASLNIKEIAQRANISVGSLYQYFPNRDGLLDFAVELCLRFTTGVFQESKPMLEEGGKHHNFICIGCGKVIAGGKTPL